MHTVVQKQNMFTLEALPNNNILVKLKLAKENN